MYPNSQPFLRILALLKALHWNHWTSHWQVMGLPFYGDHLLFERLYTGIVDEVDGLAEKLVQMFGSSVVNSGPQAQWATQFLAEWEQEPDLIYRALHAEELFQRVLKETYENHKDSLSLGMDDFLMTLASAHETNLYLLGQRKNARLAKKKSPIRR